MTEMSPEQGMGGAAKPSTPAPAPAAPPADAAPAEATTRLVLVPDAFTEAFTAFVPDAGQIRIDVHGTDVSPSVAEAIIAQAEAHGLVVKEA